MQRHVLVIALFARHAIKIVRGVQTLANFIHSGCMVTAPLLLCVALVPVAWGAVILARGAQHTHEPLRQDEN